MVNEQTTETKKDPARASHLARRQVSLEKELTAAAEREPKLAELVQAAEENLREGRASAAAVEKHAAQLDAHRSMVERLKAAHASVHSELSEVQQRIASAEHERERQKQNLAAEPLRKKASALMGEFIDFAIAPGEPLLLRGVLAQELMEKFPLARRIEPVSLDELGCAFREKLHLDSERTRHWAVLDRLKKILTGLGDSFLTPAEAKNLHVRL